MTTTLRHAPAAPTIPAAGNNGLISTSDLKNDLTVIILSQPQENPFVSYELLINGLPGGDPINISSPLKEGTQIILNISVESHLTRDGYYHVGYRITPFPGGTWLDSESTTIQVDRTPPGGSLLAPIIFPNVTFGDTLTGVIPGYSGMQPGDVIQSVCNEMNGPMIIVRPEHLTTASLHIQYEREYLLNIGSNEVTAYYLITDQAGNSSVRSIATRLTLTI